MSGPAGQEPGPLSKFIWALVGLEALIIPFLFAIGAFDSGGKEVALGIVAVTLLGLIYTLRTTDWAKEKPIEWLGLGGLIAQFIAGPFLQMHFDRYEFAESLAPEIENPLPAWVVVVGAFGALAVAPLALRYRDLVHSRLADVPSKYRSIIERSAAAAALWAVTEFLIALQLISGLHPPVWNRFDGL